MWVIVSLVVCVRENYLAMMLAVLNMLAFAWHTVLDLLSSNALDCMPDTGVCNSTLMPAVQYLARGNSCSDILDNCGM